MRAPAGPDGKSRNWATIVRYSLPERWEYRCGSSGTYPMRCLNPIGSRRIGSPSNRISPEVGSIRPVIILIVVDLPEPFGPR